MTRSGGGCGGGQGTANCAQITRQTEFAEKFERVEICGGPDLPARNEHAHGNRKIETPAIFGQVGGREIDGDAPSGKLEARVDQRCSHPLLSFL